MFMFGDTPASYQEAWTCIKRLVKEWHAVDLDWNVADYHSQINELEANLGFAVPASFKEWYCFLEIMRRTDQWIFRDSYCIKFDKGIQALTLLIQGEADYYWAVKKENLRLEDPPVDGYLLDYESDTERFLWDKVWSSRLSFFVIKYILSFHHSFEGVGGYDTSSFDTTLAMDEFRQAFARCTQVEDYWVFESPGVIATITDNQAFGGMPCLSVHYKTAPPHLPECVLKYFKNCYCYSGPKLSDR